MDIFSKIAEEKIKEAMEKGEFDNLKGAGKPLSFDDDSSADDCNRLAYRILKNAGFIPPELELKKEIEGLIQLIASTADGEEKAVKMKELSFRLMKYSIIMKRPLSAADFPQRKDKASAGT